MIVEEAAEVLESHIVCSLTSDGQQLIIIGDHQQLRPSVNVHHLATKYQLDVSLFERLILGGMKSVRLGVQHRMRPEVARLIVPTIYSQLENHRSVYGHPRIRGMQRDVCRNYFIIFCSRINDQTFSLRCFFIITITKRKRMETVFTMFMKCLWLFTWRFTWCESKAYRLIALPYWLPTPLNSINS